MVLFHSKKYCLSATLLHRRLYQKQFIFLIALYSRQRSLLKIICLKTHSIDILDKGHSSFLFLVPDAETSVSQFENLHSFPRIAGTNRNWVD